MPFVSVAPGMVVEELCAVILRIDRCRSMRR
jgi:hypothetical protein